MMIGLTDEIPAAWRKEIVRRVKKRIVECGLPEDVAHAILSKTKKIKLTDLAPEVQRDCRKRLVNGQICDIPLSNATLKNFRALRKWLAACPMKFRQHIGQGYKPDWSKDSNPVRFQPGSREFWVQVVASNIIGELCF